MRSTAFRYLNRMLCLLLCAVFLGLLCTGVGALPENRCQLVIDCRCEEASVSGAVFRLYRVAELNSQQLFSYTGAFSDLELDAKALSEAGELLYGMVEAEDLLPDYTLITDSQGKASVADVAPGVFLLVGDPTTVEGYTYYVDKQVVFLREECLTLHLKSTRLPVEEQLISIEVRKLWDDQGYEHKRPKSITARLLKDGQTVDSVILSAGNGWSYTWENLLPNVRWTVTEDVPKNYTLSIQEHENRFTLTNHYKTIPQTGQIWWPVLTVLCVGLVLIVVGLSVRRSGRNEA